MTKQNKNLLYLGLAAAAYWYWTKNKKTKKTDSGSEGGSGSGSKPPTTVPANSGQPEVVLVSTKIPEIYNVTY